MTNITDILRIFGWAFVLLGFVVILVGIYNGLASIFIFIFGCVVIILGLALHTIAKGEE